MLSLEQTLTGATFPEALLSISGIIGRDLSIKPDDHEHEYGPVSKFTYADELGSALFHVHRTDCLDCDHKIVWQSRPDGKRNLDGVRRVLYRLPSIMYKKQVFLAEGEAKVHLLEEWGLAATCNPGGAGNWRPEYTEHLRDMSVVISPDNDVPGKRHALKVARELLAASVSVSILQLPGLQAKGDVVDWKEAGHTGEEFTLLVAALSPETSESLNELEREWGLVEPQTYAAERTACALEPMSADAYYGIAGEFVRLIEPHSEADPAALLVSFLLCAGNYITRNAYYLADGALHYMNEFAVIVGDSSKSRKGTTAAHVRKLFAMTDSEYASTRIKSGLSTGEGLIWAIRDEIKEHQPIKEKGGQVSGYQDVVTDPGEVDKRLLIAEGEFARVLKAMRRETSTLSAVLRETWDHGNLNILTRNQPVRCTQGHVSIVGHITCEELLKLMTSTEAANGFANRFLWPFARRSKILPFGGNLPEHALDPIVTHLRQTHEFASAPIRVHFDGDAAIEWRRVYPELSEGGPGLVGAITSRNEAHAGRLATLYALLDLSSLIKLQHLRAALAVVDYSTRSVYQIFGSKLGDDTADEMLNVLKNADDEGCTRNDLYNHFTRNTPRDEITRALNVLRQGKLARMAPEETGGRKAERWYALRVKSSSAMNPQGAKSAA